ncbi:OmpA family protein [Arcicella sp. LKC2W]|jgi:chemotaxis protein MotB|uniref:OmpA/MotB family protein n=1 Tax=Arcicella sp. LKC2W TaxID=2984198 RepID=UPI002B200105|nr:OmpA family protein [Arcicella sp. LKC2W]MEA5459753.1 OmpA family protein [Arcicella sp. LKC2W]
MNRITVFILFVLVTSSCVSKKKYVEMQDEYSSFKATSRNTLSKAKIDIKDRDKQILTFETSTRQKEKELEVRAKHIKVLEDQVDFLKKTNTRLLDRMTDLTMVSKAGAESIKKSLETLNEQSQYIENINATIQRKDSLNLSFMVALKRALNDFSDEDLNIKVKKGLVSISVSDKVFFPSNNTNMSQRGEFVIEKLAKALNDHRDLDILVEGHTDSSPISADCIKDNWDLSAKRATTIVRLLQTRFGVSPDRMYAGGRSEYSPKEFTGNDANRKLNRRTDIIIMPRLDQFFQDIVNGQVK